VLHWQDNDARRHTRIVPRELLHGEGKVIAAQLDGDGLRCNVGKGAQEALRRCLAWLKTERRLTAVSSAGWHDGSFVLPDGEAVGNGDVILRPELCRSDLAFAQSGDLEDWQDQIARHCVGNSRLALLVSTAFAGALLEPMNEPSGGFHINGQSQRGKSTGAYVAASVGGKGARDGAVCQWRATANGLEGIAARHSDGCLVMDEISQADARDAGDMIYQLANQQGKQRAARDGSARQRVGWRLMYISTGEVTLQQRMSDAGKRSTSGMEVRLINVPSDAGAGMGIFENLHGFAHLAELADHLRAACAAYYGVAGRAFIARLVEARQKDADGLWRDLDGRKRQFVADRLPEGSDGQVRSVCARFGVVAAAGELATQWRILPWPAGEATKAAATCFAAWLEQRDGIGAGEVQAAIRQVRAFLEQHGYSRFSEVRLASLHPVHSWQRNLNLPEASDQIGESRTLNRCGWRKLEKDAESWQYYILPEAWRDEVCRGIDPDLAARAVADAGWLEKGEGRNLSIKRAIPEHGRCRVYSISGAIIADA
jgi:uncharacterized protein (DUF927 family)